MLFLAAVINNTSSEHTIADITDFFFLTFWKVLFDFGQEKVNAGEKE